ncbi:MAG: alpha/beta hydrolase [Myxococcales bacterium]
MSNRPIEILEAQTGDAPGSAIIVMHGLGDNGRSFVPLCEELDLSSIGPVRFIFPNAPSRPVTANGGYVMPAWYDILQFGGQAAEDEAGLRASQAVIDAVLERERERGIPSHRIVLAGFSQGCAMTLMTGLRHGHRLGGLVGLSGYLPLASKTAAERNPANDGVPVFLGHGTQDDIVGIERGREAREALQALGHQVEWHDYPMPHSICQEEVADLNAWLLRVLA